MGVGTAQVFALQRAIGNRSTTRLLQRDSPRLQVRDLLTPLPRQVMLRELAASEREEARQLGAWAHEVWESIHRRHPVIALRERSVGPPPTQPLDEQHRGTAASRHSHEETHLQVQAAVAGGFGSLGGAAALQGVVQVVWQWHDDAHWGPEFSIGVQGNEAINLSSPLSGSSGAQLNVQVALASRVWTDAVTHFRGQDQYFLQGSAGVGVDVPQTGPDVGVSTHPAFTAQVGYQHNVLVSRHFQVFVQPAIGGGVTWGVGGIHTPAIPFWTLGITAGIVWDAQTGGDR